MSKYRKSMSDGKSRKMFTAGSYVHPRNTRPMSARGGERL